MYSESYFNPSDPNDYDNDNAVKDIKKDLGLNTLTRKIKIDGKIKSKKIRVFTSGDVGTRIRDAVTGEYYQNKVGSSDEDLFFKVAIATGECNSENGSNTAFYSSPNHYKKHLYETVKPECIANWEAKRNERLKEMKMELKSIMEPENVFVVH